MARSPVVLVLLATTLCLVLSTLHLFHQFGHSIHRLWPSETLFSGLSGQQSTTSSEDGLYLLGVGKADITGPVVEINFMGYANSSQLGTGLRQRLYSRAFIIGDVDNPNARFVYLVLDTQSGDTAVRHGILEALKNLGPAYAIYGQENVAVTGTHSHSGPGAWLNYLLPQITSKGFDKSSYQAIVDGAVSSIQLAHDNLAPGYLSVGETDIPDANINRSPYAYLANPSEERARYEDDVDKKLTMLRFRHAMNGDNDIGVLTWFAVHGTSMLGNNTLVSGDNKGVAARLFEQNYAQWSQRADTSFVAGFSQANVGDTTPNILGAYCEYGDQAGEECDFKTSLCSNKSEPCRGRGPLFGRGDVGEASAFEIGRRQSEGAWDLWQKDTAFKPIRGKMVQALHQYVNLAGYSFVLPNGTSVTTCPAALGYSFAAGTSDGPGLFDFKQGQPNDPNANPLWSSVGGLIHSPNDTQKECHREKVILLDVGESHRPYDWTPNIVDMQLLRVGQMFIIVSPGEATTMAGRRWREAVSQTAAAMDSGSEKAVEKPVVVLGGPANTYAHYITTPEEYAVQRYEGASTLYGPHTLDAYIHWSMTNLRRLLDSKPPLKPLDPGPSPPIHTNKSLSFITPVIVDTPGLFHSFGDILEDIHSSCDSNDGETTIICYSNTVSATFIGANPRNAMDGNFAAVESLVDGTWKQFRSDADWDLVFEWKRTSTVLGTSEVTITWETKYLTGAYRDDNSAVPVHQLLPGEYRLRYKGAAKRFGGSIEPFEMVTSSFRFGAGEDNLEHEDVRL